MTSPPRIADPRRFPALANTGRPIVLLLGASLLLGALLTAAPRELSGAAAAIVVGGAWLSLVLTMTLPRQSERAGQELVRRLAQFRHEIIAVGDAPSRAVLARLIARAGELDLREDEVGDDLEQLQACLEAVDLKERITRGDCPRDDSPPFPLSPGDACCFACAVRFGRRRSDQFGHLVLSSEWLKFRGPADLSIHWTDVASVSRAGKDIVVTMREASRLLRFSCTSYSDAARGGVVAEHLAQSARVDAGQPTTGYQATV